MKKLLTLLLTVTLLASPATIASAEVAEIAVQQKVSLTEEQKQAREAYMAVHFDLMNQLTELRVQTRASVEANNNMIKEIKEKSKGKAAINQENVTEIKELAAQSQNLIKQAKQIHQQRLAIRTQYKEAVKARDLEKMKTLQTKIAELNNEIKNIKEELQSIKTEAEPLKEEIKILREGNKQLKENAKTQLQEVKALGDDIRTQQEEKEQLWLTYKENIKNEDYSSAKNTLKMIIEKKTSILEDIKKRGQELTEILATLS